MTMLRFAVSIVQAWIATTASAFAALLDRLVSPAVVRLVERETGGFQIQRQGRTDVAIRSIAEAGDALAGKRAEIVLQPRRFLFRPLELPLRAAEFLDGIVRAQIDRLTPWQASDAVFGCSHPVPNGPGVTTLVAATMRSAVAPLIAELAALRPASMALFAAHPDQGTQPIRVFAQTTRGWLDPARLAGVLGILLMLSAVAAGVTSLAAALVADQLAGRQDDLLRNIAQSRAAQRGQADGAARAPLTQLAQRKHDMPASVIVLDALARALPDHSYLTEMHLAGTRLQIVGITRDAPSLIALMEQSPHFTRATFYAPTTRTASDSGERFHIEARVAPRNASTP